MSIQRGGTPKTAPHPELPLRITLDAARQRRHVPAQHELTALMRGATPPLRASSPGQASLQQTEVDRSLVAAGERDSVELLRWRIRQFAADEFSSVAEEIVGRKVAIMLGDHSAVGNIRCSCASLSAR
jgi:hypothetical protein